MTDTMGSVAEEEAALSDFEDGDLEAAPVVLPTSPSESSEDNLQRALLEVEAERERIKVLENEKASLESKLNRMLVITRDAIKQKDEFSKKRDLAILQKEEAFREKEDIGKQLNEALRMKDDAIKQREEILKQRNDIGKQLEEVLRMKDDAIKEREDILKQRNEFAKLKDEATKARETSRSEIEAAAQLLISGAEKISSKVSSIRSFPAGLPRSPKHTGVVAIAYGALKRAEEIVEELVRQHEIITKGRNEVREQMEQRNYQIAIEVSQLEATITSLRDELGSKCIESENLQKLVLAKDGRISELESEMSEKLDLDSKEYESLKRFANETEDKLNNLEMKIEKQKPIISDQSVVISKAQGCLKNIIQMIDKSTSDPLEFSETLFVSQDLDIDKDLVALLAGATFVTELTTMAEKKLMANLEKRNKEKKDLENKIISLEVEKRDISTLLRGALKERLVAEAEDNGEKEAGSEQQKKGTNLQVAPRNIGFDLSSDVLIGDQEHVDANGTEKGGNEFLSLASAMRNTIKTSWLEISELRESLEAARAEVNHLREVSQTQSKDLVEKVLYIKELEEKERAASENVEGLMMDIAAAEEEIARWRNAAEQEAAAGKAIMVEFQEEITSLKQDIEEMKQSLDEANSKLKSKKEMAAAAVAARDTAEKSLQLADERASRLRARIEELTRQLEELDGKDEQQNIRRMRYACWPLQWLTPGTLASYIAASRDTNNNSAEMELSDPLLL